MRNLVLIAIASVASGCVVVHDNTGGVGDGVPTGAPVSRIAVGVPTTVAPGVEAGYGITANVGASYRLVWTGDAAASQIYREFYGSVWTPGVFDGLTPGCDRNACPLEGDDFLSQPIAVPGGYRIDFDAFTTTGLDGFDFTATAEPVYFDLFIDGVRYPSLVVFPDGSTGGSMASAPGLPFGLVTQ
jgi:hypothetical protein